MRASLNSFCEPFRLPNICTWHLLKRSAVDHFGSEIEFAIAKSIMAHEVDSQTVYSLKVWRKPVNKLQSICDGDWQNLCVSFLAHVIAYPWLACCVTWPYFCPSLPLHPAYDCIKDKRLIQRLVPLWLVVLEQPDAWLYMMYSQN